MKHFLLSSLLVAVVVFGVSVSLNKVGAQNGDAYTSSFLADLSAAVKEVQTKIVQALSNSSDSTVSSGKTTQTVFSSDEDYFRKLKLSVSMDGNGNGKVTGPGILCKKKGSSKCKYDHVKGVIVPLTATPTASSTFTGWQVIKNSTSTGECINTTLMTCQITMDEAKKVQATFVLGSTSTAQQIMISKNIAFPDTILVTGAISIKIGSYSISVSSNEGVRVNNLTITINSSSTNFQNLRAMIGGIQFGSTYPVLSQGNYTFYGEFLVSAATTQIIDVYADVLPNANAGDLGTVTTLTSLSGAGQITGSLVSWTTPISGQNISIQSTRLYIQLGANTPTAGNLFIGSTNNPVLEVKVSNIGGEDIKITQMTFTDAFTGTPTASFLNMGIYDGDTKLGTMSVPIIYGSSSLTISSNLDFIVLKNSAKSLILRGDVASSAVVGSVHTWKILPADVSGYGVVIGNSATIDGPGAVGYPQTIVAM